MAARVVAWEALGAPEVPTFRPTPGAGLEAAGVQELEEEEEQEEVEEALARRARSFAQDARVRFLGGCLEQMLGLRAEKWSQHLESEDSRKVLGEFLESPGPARLVFGVVAGGRLEASREVRSDQRGHPATPAPGIKGTWPGTGQSDSLGSAGHTPRGFKKLFWKSALEPAEPPTSAHSAVKRLKVVF